MTRLLRVIVVISTFFGGTAAFANTNVTVCNGSEWPVYVSVIYSDRQNGSETITWTEAGWLLIPVNECKNPRSVRSYFWNALAFATKVDDEFVPFTYEASEQFNRSGEAEPAFSAICVTSNFSRFSRTGISPEDIGTSCAAGADQIIPVSVKLYSSGGSSFADRVVFSIDEIPGLAPLDEVSDSETVNIALWDSYITACIPVLTSRYARSTEDAIFECTCFAAAADLAVNDTYLNYLYGAPFNAELDELPTGQVERYSALSLTCTDRSMRTDPEFDSVVSVLAAPRIAAFLEPTEELVLGEYMGLIAYENGNGPLKIIDTVIRSQVRHLQIGDVITRVKWTEVRNLNEFRAAIEAAKAEGLSSIELGLKSSLGFYGQEIRF